jgi:hypothetical protein
MKLLNSPIVRPDKAVWVSKKTSHSNSQECKVLQLFNSLTDRLMYSVVWVVLKYRLILSTMFVMFWSLYITDRHINNAMWVV